MCWTGLRWISAATVPKKSDSKTDFAPILLSDVHMSLRASTQSTWPPDGGTTINESRLLRAKRSRNRRQYAQSGLSPYLLILACPSDVHMSLRASTQSTWPPSGTFIVRSESRPIRSYKPYRQYQTRQSPVWDCRSCCSPHWSPGNDKHSHNHKSRYW